MSLLTIAVVGNPLLREKAATVNKFDKKLGYLLRDMAETMYKADGVGIAAPQVNVSKRLVVIDPGDGLREFVNPVLSNLQGSAVNIEGCLSVPTYEGEVERATNVTVSYQDRKGQEHVLEAEGLLAIALQHEVDHLDGILFIDKAQTLRPKEQSRE